MARRPIFDPERMKGPGTAGGPRSMRVSQLTTLIKSVLTDHLPSTIHLVGEISNLSRPSSGHLYMTLKDDRSEMRAVMWRSTAAHMTFKPQDGLEVIATGHIDVYEPRGQYQFYIRKLEPRGTGALELAFRQQREKLQREGLFDDAQKKPIPRFPHRIGVVTSSSGAAIRDILQTISRRFPAVEVLVRPTRVQGEGAAEEIARAIQHFNEQRDPLGGIDVLIVGRGGGSLEDLWAFNEEAVARAIHASTIPVISAVGHEVDVTIADLVADLRAPTPTAAAELAVPVLADVRDELHARKRRMDRAMGHRFEIIRSRLSATLKAPCMREPTSITQRANQQVDELAGRARLAALHRLGRDQQHLHAWALRLAEVQPHAVLEQRRQRLAEQTSRLTGALARRLRDADTQLHQHELGLVGTHPRHLLQHHRHRLNLAKPSLHQAIKHRLDVTRPTLNALLKRLETTSYRKTLARGFTLTRDAKTGRLITDPAEVQLDQSITTETAQGAFTSRVTPEPPKS